MDATYKDLSPANYNASSNIEDDNEEIVLVLNILTGIDIRHPPKEGDIRLGDVYAQKERILNERQRNRLRLSTKPFK